MDGLECSEINRSELERTLRIDSEFYSKSAIKVSDTMRIRTRLNSRSVCSMDRSITLKFDFTSTHTIKKETPSECRRHTESVHDAVFLNLPRKRCKKSGIAPNGTIPDFCLFSANDVCKRSYIKGLQVSSCFVNAQKIAHISLIAACAAARRAMGTRNGLQET